MRIAQDVTMIQSHRYLRLVALALSTIILAATRATAADAPLDGLDAYVAKAMTDWQVPGTAIAIVKDDTIVYAKGFGLRKLGEDKPVDAGTLFAIGSASKAFTAASLAILIDEGKLNWDDPATQYLPTLALFDPYVTRELTVRDLLCHRSGLPRGDLLWYGTTFDRGEILRRVRYLKPEWSFRSRFGYQNIMYLAAGEVVAKTAGQGWDDFIKQRLFLPLGMKSSCTSVRELSASDNVATPHVKIEDKVEPIAWRNIDNIAPAGSINSSVTDMAQWVRLQLGQGAIDGKRLVSEAAVKEMHASQTVMPKDENSERLYPDAHLLAYGLGWFLHDYHGRKIVEHGGAIDGMRAQVALIPEEKLGLVILMNRGGTALPTMLMFHVFDQFLKTGTRDWSGEGQAWVKKLEEQAREAKAKQEAERAKDTKPSLALEKYAGRYADELYGEAEITLEDGKLVLRRGPAFTADLEHWHYDTFRAKFRDRTIEPQLITFRLDAAGKVATIEMPGLGQFKAQAAK
ncbi:MAG: serine hydrolase [Planctomycetia bacterium]|nr:serine hydrolase [Planctomycetia bacterium]